MHAVPHVVVVGELAGQPQTHSLDGAGLPRGSALGGRGLFPALPADARDVGVDLDGGAVRVVGAREGDHEVLDGAPLARRARGGAVFDGRLPADARDVGPVAHAHGLLLERVVDVRAVGGGGGAALPHEPHLHRLELAPVARGAGVLAVLGPAHPADVGGVHAVVDVVEAGHLPREAELQGLDAPGLAGGAALGGGRLVPALPAHVGDMGVDFYGARSLGIGERDLHGLQRQGATGGSGRSAIGNGAKPADVGDVGRDGDMRTGCHVIGVRAIALQIIAVAIVHIHIARNARNTAPI